MIPKKRTYSDREVEEILKSLFLEKKKVNELELSLENSKLSPSMPAVENEIKALKEEAASWKKRYEEGQKSPSSSSSTKEAQLERVVAFMRHKCDQAELEQKELLKKINELESRDTASETDQEALTEAQEELQALQGQMEALRNIAKASEETKGNLEKQLQEQQEKLAATQRELEAQRQMMTASLQEFKDERKKQQEADQKHIQTLVAELAQEKESKSSGYHTLEEKEKSLEFIRSQLDAKQKEAEDAFKNLQEQLIAHQELVQFTDELKSKIQKAEDLRRQAQDSLSQRDSQIESLNAQVANLARSLSDSEETATHALSERNEQESRLRVAQQHLAKKVRESTLLAEKNEELKLRIAELEQSLEASKNKQVELQTALDSGAAHQKQLQEQYQESLKSHEAQSTRWEARYLELHSRCQDLETRNRELKHLEERFSKMQQALSQLGSIIGSPMPLSIQDVEIIEEPPERPSQSIKQPPAPCSTIQTSLFEAQESQPRFKESLFG